MYISLLNAPTFKVATQLFGLNGAGVLIILMILPFLGFLRSVATGIKPSFILDQKQVQDEWLNRSPFSAILLPIMGFFIFIFNAFAWAIYSLISIIEFIGFIFKAIWWAILWLWNEFIHPVVFFIAKLVWHYVIVWSWRFFKLAITRIPEAFSVQTFKKGFLSVLSLSFIAFFFIYLSNMLQQEWILIIMVFALLFGVTFFTLYTLYDDEKRHFDDFWTKTVLSKLGIMVIACIVSASIIVALHMFAGTAIQIPLLGIAYPVSIILLVVGAVAMVLAMVTNAIAPAYTKENKGNFEEKGFLINTGIRLPRLVGSTPFLIIGGIITSLLTIIIGSFLWWSTNTIKETFCLDAQDNVQSELSITNEHFNTFYNTNTKANIALDFTNKHLKRIATLESRDYALNLLAQDWFQIVQNLPEGFRTTHYEKQNIERLQQTYASKSVELSKMIGKVEKNITQLRSNKNHDPSDVEAQIEMEKSRLENLKNRRGLIESQHILSTSLTEFRIGSIKYTNVMWVIGTFFAMLGLVILAAIVFTPYWIYRTKFFFDLYSYHHKGKSYLQEQIDFYKARNKNQPLLGFFVLLTLIIIGVILPFILIM